MNTDLCSTSIETAAICLSSISLGLIWKLPLERKDESGSYLIFLPSLKNFIPVLSASQSFQIDALYIFFQSYNCLWSEACSVILATTLYLKSEV